MESIIQKSLQKYLGPFLLDFNPKHNSKFKFSLGKGQTMTLRDLKIDPQFLSKLMPGIPLVITQGTIDTCVIRAKIHSLKSEPVVVELGTVFLEIKEPVEILQYQKDEGGSKTPTESGEKVVNGTSSNGSSRDVDGETRQGPNGQTLRKRQKKNYPATAKVFHGIHWKIKEIKIQLSTLGDLKTEFSGHNLAGPPQVNIFIRDLDLCSVDQHGAECPNLKKSRAYSKFLEEEIYVFKKGTCSISLSLTPANPWFPDVSVLEACPLSLDITAVSEPVWATPKGEEVSVDRATEIKITSQAPISCHLDGEELLHVGECLKGLSSCFSRLDIPMNPTKYGRELDGPTIGVTVVIPEIVISALLHGPAPPWGEGRKGLALRVENVLVAFVMGPEDYSTSRTQLEIGGLKLFDLADPERCYVEAPCREVGEALMGDNIELVVWSCHPHQVALEAQKHSEAVVGRRRKFLRLQYDSKNPWFSDYRPPAPVIEQELVLIVDGLTVSMDAGIVDYALCIQTLVTMGLALESVPAPQESPRYSLEYASADVERETEEISIPSILIVRSDVKIIVSRPLIQVQIPTLSGVDSHISLYFDGFGLEMHGRNCNGPEDVVNDIGWKFWCEDGGLFCDDPQFAVNTTAEPNPASCQQLGAGVYALVFLPGVEAEGNILVEPEEDGDGTDELRGNISEVTALIDGKEIAVSIQSQHLQQLLWGLSTRYEQALMAFQGSAAQQPPPHAHTRSASTTRVAPRYVRHASDVKSQPVISVTVAVSQVSLLVAGGRAHAKDKDERDADGGEEAWMKLLFHGDSSFQIVGGLLSRLSVRVPSVQLLSRGTHMIWKEKGVETLLSVIWEKQDLEALQRRLLLPSLVGWKQAVVLLKGLRVQVNQGLVTDLDKFVRDLSGVKEVGTDIGVIVHQVFSVVKMDSDKANVDSKKKGNKKKELSKLKKAVTTRPGAAVPNIKRDRNIHIPAAAAGARTSVGRTSAAGIHGSRTSGSGLHSDGGLGVEGAPLAQGETKDPTSLAGLEALALSFINALPAEVDLQGQDCRVEIESSYECDSAASTVSFSSVRLRRGREGDASGEETDKEEWDGMVLQLKGLQLMDKRDMQESHTIPRRALPSSKEDEDEDEDEDESGGESDEAGEKRRKKKGKGKQPRQPQALEEEEDLVLASTSRLQPFGLTCVMEWRTIGEFRPHFRVSGDKIHMVLQAPILLTIMGVFYELDTLKTTKREKKIEAASSQREAGAEPQTYSRRTSMQLQRNSLEILKRESMDYPSGNPSGSATPQQQLLPVNLNGRGEMGLPSPRPPRSPLPSRDEGPPALRHETSGSESGSYHRERQYGTGGKERTMLRAASTSGGSDQARAASSVPPLYDGERGRPQRLASGTALELARAHSGAPGQSLGDDVDGKEGGGRVSTDAARGSGEYYYRKQVTKIRRDQEETKRMVKRQEQHYMNMRSLLEAATELVRQSPDMAAQILDDLLVETQQGQDDVGILARHVNNSSTIQLAPGDNSQ